MDLNYIASNDEELLKRIEDLGCDLESLFYISKDIFSIFDNLNLSSKESAEFFIRIKNALDVSEGKAVPENIIIYENDRKQPTRLSVENKESGNMIFFKVVPGQSRVIKGNALYNCESCSNNIAIKRVHIRRHIETKHNNLI